MKALVYEPSADTGLVLICRLVFTDGEVAIANAASA
jgi:hypothetical protein